ncbi:hypothetical protein BJV77DRAFT_802079 [Russula vinacea]|nr:hypothetical protein BJV77DRAFT_802079 [Russula vinacea]
MMGVVVFFFSLLVAFSCVRHWNVVLFSVVVPPHAPPSSSRLIAHLVLYPYLRCRPYKPAPLSVTQRTTGSCYHPNKLCLLERLQHRCVPEYYPLTRFVTSGKTAA